MSDCQLYKYYVEQYKNVSNQIHKINIFLKPCENTINDMENKEGCILANKMLKEKNDELKIINGCLIKQRFLCELELNPKYD